MCSSKKSDCKTHPDGGWGWCVVVAAFITQFVVVGLQNSSGVIFNELVQKFNKPRGETGFVSSISVGMMFLLGPFTTSLCQRFTCRRISALGGFLCTLGMIASAYAHTLELMYISFGIVWGLGTSFCYFPAMIVLVPYFEKRLPLVTGIVSSGSGFGTLVLSPFIQWFAHQYGVKNAFLMLASLHGIVFFAGLVYRPVGKKYKIRQEVKYIDNNFEEEKDDIALSSHSDECQAEDLRCLKPIEKKTKMRRKKNKCGDSEIGTLFRNKAYVAWCFGLSVFILGYFVPFVHLVRYAVLIGIPEVKSAFLISTLSISATIFKLVSGKVAGLKGVNKMKIYQIGLLLMGIGTTLIPISHSFFGLMVYCVVYGFGESIFIVMIPLITKEIVGVNHLPLALGCVFMIMGIPTTVGAPIAGWIYDYFNDYSYAFFVAGCMNVVGVLVMFLVEYFKENDAAKMFIPEKTSKSSEEDEKLYTNAKTNNGDPFLTKHKCFGSSQQIFYADNDIDKFNRMLCAECEKNCMKELSTSMLEEGEDNRIQQNVTTKQPKYYNKPIYQRHLLKKLNESKTTLYTDSSGKIPMFLSENQTFIKEDHPIIQIASNKNSTDNLKMLSECRNNLAKNTSTFQHVPNKMSLTFLDNFEEDQADKFIQVYNDEKTGKLIVESIMTAV